MDTNKLKELAERAQISRGGEWYNEGDCCWWTGRPDEGDFMAATNPQAILGLIERLEKAEQHWANENSNNMALIAEVERLRGCVQEWERSIGAKAYIDSVMLRDEVERLRTRLEIDDRTPYDGIACRDETIKGLDEKCDRLKAENKALRQFAAEAYQVLGALDAPENVLDNASDAAGGVPPRHETLLPFFAEGYEALRKDAERYRWLKENCDIDYRGNTPYELYESTDAAIDAALEGCGR